MIRQSSFANDAGKSVMSTSGGHRILMLLRLKTDRFQWFDHLFWLRHKPHPQHLLVTPILIVGLKQMVFAIKSQCEVTWLKQLNKPISWCSGCIRLSWAHSLRKSSSVHAPDVPFSCDTKRWIVAVSQLDHHTGISRAILQSPIWNFIWNSFFVNLYVSLVLFWWIFGEFCFSVGEIRLN